MSNALRSAVSHEADYYLKQDQMHDEALLRERLDGREEEILGGFDAKDVMAALDVVADSAPERLHRFHEALAIIPHIQTWKIEDPGMRAVAQAFQSISHYYSGFTAMKEATQ